MPVPRRLPSPIAWLTHRPRQNASSAMARCPAGARRSRGRHGPPLPLPLRLRRRWCWRGCGGCLRCATSRPPWPWPWSLARHDLRQRRSPPRRRSDHPPGRSLEPGSVAMIPSACSRRRPSSSPCPAGPVKQPRHGQPTPMPGRSTRKPSGRRSPARRPLGSAFTTRPSFRTKPIRQPPTRASPKGNKGASRRSDRPSRATAFRRTTPPRAARRRSPRAHRRRPRAR